MGRKKCLPLPELEFYANNFSSYISLLKMTKAAVAIELGVSDVTIGNISNGILKMPCKLAYRFMRFAEWRGVQVDLSKIIPPNKWDIDFKKRKNKILKLEDFDSEEV